jgi:hypothetical protein
MRQTGFGIEKRKTFLGTILNLSKTVKKNGW